MRWQLMVAPDGAGPVILGTHRRVGHDGCVCVIVPDNASGGRDRYTVYRLPGSPSRGVRVIGRELPWSDAVRVSKQEVSRTKDRQRESTR